ncbi:enoyl-CoA hydratase/isomerase family protein [Facklamia sp. DSM 111018]|uniref:Enoyl-CoA hydratase/isomerase family protein n=1 Tax=Facklamia lactis TaxID=2749967 RepID=A0ABS0LQN9_9LACT|nr:enoyl-CoA hydratase-related protein [Facklamia lactis]MBG9980527.1 enoyl-CoA hydratase/isomerase family protein [Facklamia lactis]MBG9986319.1 enoyl-CoA hydratase/isomerase family protein [Facklamia lactis]
MKQYNTLQFNVEEQIGTLTINRPKALNALNTELMTELIQILDDIQENQEVQVLVITGSGEKAFVAGADIKEMADKKAMEGKEFSHLGNKVCKKIANLRQPVIAAVNGYALGGGLEIASACDIRIGSKNAVVGQPEVGLGIIPGFGGTQRLSRLIGLAKAKELIYTGKNIKAEEAYEIGIFNHLAEPEKLMEEVYEMAHQILKNAPLAVEGAKKAIDKGYEMPIDHALAFEEDIFGLLFDTQDQKDGMQAFLNKKEAKFNKK